MGAVGMSDDLPPGFVMTPTAAPAATPTQAAAGDLPPGFVMNGGQTSAPAPESWVDRTIIGRAAKSLYSAVTLPGDVYQGKVQVMGPDGHTNPEVIGRAAELAAVASPTPVATRAGVGFMGVPIKPTTTPVAPTAEALEQAAKSGYEQARGLGVEIRPQPISDLGMRIGADLNEKGIQSELAPKTFATINKLASPPGESVVTVQNLEALRRTFGNAAKDFTNPTEQLAAKHAQRALDDYMAALPAEDVVRGPAAEVSKILSEARGNYAAAQRSGQITGALADADISAAAANSGQNIGNSIRQRLKSIQQSDKKTAGYNAEEIAQLERVIRGTAVGNTARFTGNLLGGGGGLGSVISAAAGAGTLGPVGAATPAVGFALKKLSDASVSRQARLLDEAIRLRSPLAEKLTAANTRVPEGNPNIAAIARLLSLNRAPRN